MKTFDVEIELSLDRAGKYGVDGPYDAPTIRMDPFRILLHTNLVHTYQANINLGSEISEMQLGYWLAWADNCLRKYLLAFW